MLRATVIISIITTTIPSNIIIGIVTSIINSVIIIKHLHTAYI